MQSQKPSSINLLTEKELIERYVFQIMDIFGIPARINLVVYKFDVRHEIEGALTEEKIEKVKILIKALSADLAEIPIRGNGV